MDSKARIRIRMTYAEEDLQVAADVRSVQMQEAMFLPRSSVSRTDVTVMRRAPVIRIVTTASGTERERILLPRISFAARRGRRFRPSRVVPRLRRHRKSR